MANDSKGADQAPAALRRNYAGAGPLQFDQSKRLMELAKRWLAGGVTSNFRLGIQPTPLVIERAEGAHVFDADGNRLTDYYLGMGPIILGHNPIEIREAVTAQLARGILYAGQTTLEAEAARRICALVPSAERLRFASSGTEAVQAALRLARAATGRKTIVKFEGHYHGWLDNILWSAQPALEIAGPDEAPIPVPMTKGQDLDAGRNLAVLPWNDLAAVEARLARGDVAGVIMEPAMCNSGAIMPLPGYLEGVRAACSRHGTILIFDEVVTGFRVAPGGAQSLFGVTPDLSTFAKAIANGWPVAAVVGRADLMELFVSGGVVHGGTYNGQAVVMAATVATLTALEDEALFKGMAQRGRRLMDGIAAALKAAGIPATVTGFPQIFHVAFGPTEPVRNYRELTRRSDKARYVKFTTALLHRGVRALERGAWFMSAAHDDAVIDETLAAVAAAAREV
jgi:glutamate-1-semialdehyde 2,1-aminomutase